MNAMFTRHFLKTLIMFTGMIVLGLLGVSLVSYFGKGEAKSTPKTSNTSDKTAPVAK